MVLLLIAAVTTISVTLGAIHVSPDEIVKILANKTSGKEIFAVSWEQKTENIIWNIRFPRVIMAFIVGAGLSLCGVLMQALTKNPLADPYVLGISSGASAGAVSVIILGLFSFMGGYSVIFGATLGAAVAISLSLSIASVKGRITSTQLVLAGIATSALFSALTNLIVYGFNNGSDKTKDGALLDGRLLKRSYLEPGKICVHRVCCYDGSDSVICAGAGHSSFGR